VEFILKKAQEKEIVIVHSNRYCMHVAYT